MLLCPETALAAEICDCGNVHICPRCDLVIPENADPFNPEPTCSCEFEDEVEAILEAA